MIVGSVAEFERERAASAFGDGCPAASKIGGVEVETPLLEGTLLQGSAFVATPRHNLASNSLIALYITVKEPRLGINAALVGRVVPEPGSGRLVAYFGEDREIPQVPVSRFHFHFREGGRSPLITPPLCGSYALSARFTPRSAPGSSVAVPASFTIDHGPGGGPCPPGVAPFDPGFEAGTETNQAGTHAAFDMRLTRHDGDRDLTRFSASLPPGLVARLAGVSQCPDAQIAIAKQKTGLAELASPSCPTGSKIGRVQAGAGAGSELTYVNGSLYLAGPYNGAPLSVVAIVPAVAGPFDVGVVVTRFALRIDPRSARVTVDGAASDPIPHSLEGIPLAVRDIRAYVDRPEFTLNPTSCARGAVGAQIEGGGAVTVSRDAPFQAAGCRGLAFKPRLSLRLRGGTRRGAFPRLHLAYAARPGDANLKRLALRFPRSEFIEQGHFRTICTRVQFAAGAGNGARCPKGSVYGHAKVFTPLLSEPLTGPVFLRSSDHNLPDAVLALHGPPSAAIDLEARPRASTPSTAASAPPSKASPTPPSPASCWRCRAEEGPDRQLHQPLSQAREEQGPRQPARPERPQAADQAEGGLDQVREAAQGRAPAQQASPQAPRPRRPSRHDPLGPSDAQPARASALPPDARAARCLSVPPGSSAGV